jgi:Amt family ammonium transporter
VSKEGELYGLDLHEHGISAYPEYVISALAAPAGLAEQQKEPTMVAKPVSSTFAFQKTTGS